MHMLYMSPEVVGVGTLYITKITSITMGGFFFTSSRNTKTDSQFTRNRDGNQMFKCRMMAGSCW